MNNAGIWSNYAGSNGKGSVFGGWGNQEWTGRATYRYMSQYQNPTTAAGFGTTQQNVASFGSVDLDAEYRYPPYDSSSLIFALTNTPYDAFTYDDVGAWSLYTLLSHFEIAG